MGLPPAHLQVGLGIGAGSSEGLWRCCANLSQWERLGRTPGTKEGNHWCLSVAVLTHAGGPVLEYQATDAS